MSENIERDEFLDNLKQLAKPVDIESLIADGIIEESGSSYILLKPDELPQHVWKHVTSLQTGHKRGAKIKIKDCSTAAKAAYEKIADKPLEASE